MKKYDVIVIGAGNGGLAAACTAAKGGLKTLLVEQHNLPGGFASSFVRGRFEFEPSLHELCGVKRGDRLGSVGKFFQSVGVKLDWIEVDEAYRLLTTEEGDKNLDVTMPLGLDNYIAKLEEYVPGSRPSVEKFFALIEEMVSAFSYFENPDDGKFNPLTLIKRYPNMLRVVAYTVTEVEEALKIPLEARKILNAYWCYLGVEPSRLEFSLYGAMLHSYLVEGACIPKDRSHEISSAILDKFYEYGGETMFNTRVDKILIKQDVAVGIKTKRGNYFAKRIISNASRSIVFGNMVAPDDVPEKEKRMSNARSKGPRGFVVYLGLNKSAEELGMKDYSYFIYPSMDDNRLVECLHSEDGINMIASTCLNIANPTASPEGTCILALTSMYSEELLKDWTQENYVQRKNALAKKLIEYFEKSTGIHLQEYIEEYCVASPATFANYTGAYNGCFYGYDAIKEDGVLARSIMHTADNTIKNLDFVGGFAFRLHGYSSSYISGNNVALTAVNELLGEDGKND